ncbi:MAG: NTP transferase domain-containing protein [Acidimicrobiales bacterium]
MAVLAGGKGTRLGARVQEVPKPLVEVAGEPFLFHSLRRLAASGARQVVLCVGYLGERIEQVVGHHRFGMDLAYSYDGPGLDGTLGALHRAGDLLGDRFLVLYGDTILTLDFRDLVAVWDRSALPAVMTVLENRGRWGASNTLVRNGLVEAHDKAAPTGEMSWIDYGAGGLTRDILGEAGPAETDLSALYATLAARGLLAAYPVSERFYEIGTPSSLAETEAFLAERA